MAYYAECQSCYNATERGKQRKRRWTQNLTDQQIEEKRAYIREYMRQYRKNKIHEKTKQTDC
jgi:hypothetical protein